MVKKIKNLYWNNIYFYKMPKHDKVAKKEIIKNFKINCTQYKKNQIKFGKNIKIKF